MDLEKEDLEKEILTRLKTQRVITNGDLFREELNVMHSLVESGIVSRYKRPNPEMPQDEQHYYQLKD